MVGNRISWEIRPRPLSRLSRQLGTNFYVATRLALTVYKQRGDIDPAVAPREVLMALPDINEVDVDAHVEARSDEPEGAGPLLLLLEGFAQRSKGRFLNISVKARQLAQFSPDTARNGQISARS